MLRTSYFHCLLAAACFVPTALAHATEWGHLSGRFVVTGKPQPQALIRVPCAGGVIPDPRLQIDKDRGLANAVIYLFSKDVPIAPAYAASSQSTIQMECKNCQIQPYVQLLRTSQKLEFTNNEIFGVALKVNANVNPPWQVVLEPGKTAVYNPGTKEGLPVQIDSPIHPWTRAWVVLRDNPYMALSGSDGRFTIHDLPAGIELDFSLWHERTYRIKDATYSQGAVGPTGRIKLTLRPGDNDLGDISIPANWLKQP